MPISGLPGEGEGAVYPSVATIPCGVLNGIDWDCKRETGDNVIASAWKECLQVAAWRRLIYIYTYSRVIYISLWYPQAQTPTHFTWNSNQPTLRQCVTTQRCITVHCMRTDGTEMAQHLIYGKQDKTCFCERQRLLLHAVTVQLRAQYKRNKKSVVQRVRGSAKFKGWVYDSGEPRSIKTSFRKQAF